MYGCNQTNAQYFAQSICKPLKNNDTNRLHTAGVTGSIPVPPTKFENPKTRTAQCFAGFLLLAVFVACVFATKWRLIWRKRSHMDDVELLFALAAERPAFEFGISLFCVR
jgi:hypothetical protein